MIPWRCGSTRELTIGLVLLAPVFLVLAWRGWDLPGDAGWMFGMLGLCGLMLLYSALAVFVNESRITLYPDRLRVHYGPFPTSQPRFSMPRKPGLKFIFRRRVAGRYRNYLMHQLLLSQPGHERRAVFFELTQADVDLVRERLSALGLPISEEGPQLPAGN